LPLTEPRMETNNVGDTVLTQWFERARLEYHPTQGILLGLLSNELRLNLQPRGTLIDDVAMDIDQFWSELFSSKGWDYYSPNGVLPYRTEIETACGKAALKNAFYCPRSNLIHYDEVFLYKEGVAFGAPAEMLIMAHEWGHHIQKALGILNGDYFSVQLELQADCFAGAYMRDAVERGLIGQTDVDDAARALKSFGDDDQVPWYYPGAHGTSQQRTSYFRNGARNGFKKCG
jgi:hypothetical protein